MLLNTFRTKKREKMKFSNCYCKLLVQKHDLVLKIILFLVLTCISVKLPVVDDVITFLSTASNANVITAEADCK